MKEQSIFEMNVGKLMGALMGAAGGQGTGLGDGSGNCGCKIQNAVQPDDNVGEFGNTNVINVKETDEGGLEIESSEMAVKLSSVIYDAIKSHINQKGDTNGSACQ